MIKILLVEDSQDKATRIAKVLNEIPDISYILAYDLVSARKCLESVFHILILDINLPERFGEDPKENNGLQFLNELKKSNRLKMPQHIFGLTEYEDIFTKYKDEFESKVLSIIKYDISTTQWSNSLKSRILEIVRSSQQSSEILDYDYDVAIVTALRNPEFEAILNLKYKWEKLVLSNDSSSYYVGKAKNNKDDELKIVATYLPQMGMSACSVAAIKIIKKFRPKYLIMPGICGGVKGKVSLGDIIICDLSFDAGSGKFFISNDGKEEFLPDFKTISLSGDLKLQLMEFAANKTLLRHIKDSWQGNGVINEIRAHVGPMASGASVIANANYMNNIIKHQRKLLAIDMEAYAIFYCSEYCDKPKPIPVVIKVVSDFADHEKNDSVQSYACFIAAITTDYLIENVLSY